MTMYRRFCCNDLLRLGPLNLESHNTTHSMYDYMCHLGMWPANCYVSYLPGGQITGHIFGTIEGTGLDCSGRISMLSLPLPNLNTKLTKLLENSCDKIYNACTMKMLISANNTDAIMESEELGYRLYKYYEGIHGDELEFRKPLRDYWWG